MRQLPLFLIGCSLCCCAGIGSSVYATTITQESLKKQKGSPKVLIQHLHGIVLIPSKEEMLSQSQLKDLCGIEMQQVDLPGSAADLEKKLNRFLGMSIDTEQITTIQRQIYSFYADNYYPLVIVEVPNQDVTDGVLQIVVTQSLLGQVQIEGNEKWSSLNQIKNLIRLKAGEPINERVLIGDLNFLNRSPYRTVDSVYEPGSDDRTTDLLVLVQDSKPYQLYLGTDNTGLLDTGTELYYAGFNVGLGSIGHVLSYQYTTTNFRSLQAHTAQYLAPLPNEQILNLYGGYSTVNVPSSTVLQQNSGYSIQTSGRYTIPFLPTFDLRHELTVGVDYKRTNTNLIYVPDTLLAPFNQSVNLTQLMVGYNGTYQVTGHALQYLAEIYFSPIQFLPQQGNANYNALRPGATNRWIYGRLSLYYYADLPRSWRLNLSMRGQVSTTALLASEQFGLGGYDTVRGYYERILNQDDAILLSCEVHTPTFPVAKSMKKKSGIQDELEFLVFADYSNGYLIKPIPGQPRSDYLLGVGPGLRYRLENYLTCRVDYGVKLHKGLVIGDRFGRFHFAVIGSY